MKRMLKNYNMHFSNLHTISIAFNNFSFTPGACIATEGLKPATETDLLYLKNRITKQKINFGFKHQRHIKNKLYTPIKATMCGFIRKKKPTHIYTQNLQFPIRSGPILCDHYTHSKFKRIII